VSRNPAAFTQAHADALHPIAEILAVAWVAQQLHMTVGKHRTMEVMSDLTLAVAAEINSALQTIVGHCDLLEREQRDPTLRQDLLTIKAQAERITGLLDKMRSAANERLREMADTINQEGIPTSPERD
jgi:nitrogen-specific signal transduction histidine kinase